MTDEDMIRRGDVDAMIRQTLTAEAADFLILRLAALPAVQPAPDVDEIDLRHAMMTEIEKAAAESPWVPPEYYMNEVVSDVCAFLREPRKPLLDVHALHGRLLALPAVQPAPDVAALVDAARELADIISQAFPALARDPNILKVRAAIAAWEGRT